MKESEKTNRVFAVGLCIIAFVFVAALVIYVLTIIGVLNCDSVGCGSKLDVGIFISLLAFSTAISFAIPSFISKQQIKDIVKDYLVKDYKEDVETRADNLLRTDAHLSRMIGFLLLKNHYYYWSIGWGFRALKRYKNIPGDYQKIYREFHEMTLHNIILRSIQSRGDDCCADIIYDESNSNRKNEEVQRIKIRAIKDFVDFEYEIYSLESKQNYAKELRSNFGKDLDLIHSGMVEIWKELTDKYEGSILDEVLKISAHKKDSENFKRFIDSQYNFGVEK